MLPVFNDFFHLYGFVLNYQINLPLKFHGYDMAITFAQFIFRLDIKKTV